MDNKTFMNFIGEDTLTKFKTYDAILIKEGFNNEFLTLHQMWKYFGKPDIEPKTGSKESENELAVDTGVMDPETESREPDIGLEENDIALEKPDNELDLPLGKASIELGKPEALTNEKNHEKNIDSQKKSDLTADATDSKKIHVIRNIIIHEKDTGTDSGTSNDDTSSRIDVPSLNLIQTPYPPSRSASFIDTSVSAVLSSANKTCIEAYLKVPDKPKRKNKRDVERVSYAITSRCYQECFEAKRKLKLEEEKKKLERKRLREERVAAKADSQNKRVCKSNQVIKNGNCFVCRKRIIKSSRYFICNICKKFVHHLCIPNRHKEHVPDSEDNDLFMCHVCFKEESDEEADSEKDINENDSFEPSDNKNKMDDNENIDVEEQKHDEKMEIEKDEEEEIDELFNMYKKDYAH